MVRSDERDRAGAARWLMIHDELLRGIAHTLSNRVSTIDAAAYMLELEGSDVAQQTTTLRSETARLEELLRALRLLPRRLERHPEPLMADDAVSGALSVHAHHGDLHGVPCDVEIGRDVPPGYADPIALQHALLVGLSVAGHCVKSQRAVNGAGRVLVRVTGTDDSVRFVISAADVTLLDCKEVDDIAQSDADAVSWLLDEFDAGSHPHPGGVQFDIPTLAAARRSGR